MRIKPFFIAAAVYLLLIFPLYSLPSLPSGSIEDRLVQIGDSERTVFNDKAFIFRYDEENKGPVYLPDSDFAEDIKELHDILKPEVMVEAVYFIEYPEDFDPEKEDIRSRLNKITHQVSSISGAMYYSRTEQDYAVLFEDVYAVEGPGSRKKTDDPPAPRDIPALESVYLHMKEHSLGRGYYRMDYLSKGEELAIVLTNSTAMSRIIKAVDKEEMKIFLQMIPCREGLIVYGYCGVVLQNDGLINLMMDPYYSFHRRMTAMETWLYNSLHNSEKLPPLDDPMP